MHWFSKTSLLVLYLPFTIQPESSLIFRVKSVKCEHIDPSIYNGSVTKCLVKPTRDGHGITDVRYFYGKEAYDIKVQVTISYKFPFGIKFLPYMGNFNLDVCKFMEGGQNVSIITKLAIESGLKNAGNLIHKCPYFGEEGLKNGDVQKILGGVVPQIVPKGTYGLFFRFYVKDNQTFLTAFVTVGIDAVNPLKSVRM